MLENAGRELLLERFSKRFLEKFQEYPVMTLAKEALELVLDKEPEAGIYCIGRSGVFGALWEISSASGKGFSVDLSKIPVFQETIEICEFFDVNPYMLRSGGALLVAVKNGRGVVDSCLDRNIPAAVIGMMEHHADKLVFNGEERRYLDMPSAVKIGQNAPEGLTFLY
jgi:hydrogenase maturation factor